MLSRLRSLWRNLVHRERVERDLDDELRAVFDMAVEEKRRTGLPVEAARRAVTIEMGQVDVLKGRVRDVRAGALWDAFVQDVRYGMRLLRRNPIFTLTASLSLAICLGANTTIFTLANRLLFRHPSGVADPGRLVDIAPTDGRRLTEPVLPYPAYAEIRNRVTQLEGVYAYQLNLQPLIMRRDGGTERIFGTFVTADYFTVLGVRAAAGRLFAPADGEIAGASPIVVLSHAFWKRRFDKDPAVVGQTLHAIGLYGVTAYAVTRRTREIGIRLAMGARSSDVLRMVLRQGMLLVLIGSVIGLALAAASSRVLVRLLFGVPPLDPLTFAAAAVLLSTIGLAACFVPAWHATRISAMEALRYE